MVYFEILYSFSDGYLGRVSQCFNVNKFRLEQNFYPFTDQEPNKFGCSEGNVFAADSQTCKPADEVPECRCWYACPEDSNCPDDCNADCSCPVL